MKNIAVLGCTGSIGRQTLDVIRANPDKFRAAVLCAGRDAGAMFKAAEEFRRIILPWRRRLRRISSGKAE